MDIIHIAISVRIRAVFFLSRIGPHVGCKVRMIVFHAFVDYRDNDGVVTARYLPPDIGDIDISPRDCGFRYGLVTGIAVMPLSCEHRIIENLLGRCRFGRHFFARIAFTVRHFQERGIVFYGFDVLHCRKFSDNVRSGMAFFRHHVIPPFQPVNALPSVFREDAASDFRPGSTYCLRVNIVRQVFEFHQNTINIITMKRSIDNLGQCSVFIIACLRSPDRT